MNKNFNGVQINQSVTIVEQAGADIVDRPTESWAYDDAGRWFWRRRCKSAGWHCFDRSRIQRYFWNGNPKW